MVICYKYGMVVEKEMVRDHRRYEGEQEEGV